MSESSEVASSRRRHGWQQSTRGELVAEFLGTLIIIAFGCGSVAMAAIALPGSGRGDAGLASAADWMIIAVGWGMAVTFGVYVAGGVSGAHLNPAVTLAQMVFRDFERRKVLPYIGAQLAGAFVGGLIVFFVYHDAIGSFEAAQKFERGSAASIASFGVFATSPAPYHANLVGPLITEIIGTAFLVGFIFAVTDERNTPVRANVAPVVVGLIVLAIGISFGANSGYAINPARDLGPRLVAWITGWGSVAVPGNTARIDFYMWIPIVGPMIGGLLGAGIYDKGISNVLQARGVEPDDGADEKAQTVIERN